MNTQDYFYKTLRDVDYGRYLLCLLTPSQSRSAIAALFLFHHEISKIRDQVTDTRLGHIRLQWWRDEIAKMYEGQPCGQVPILSTIAPFVKTRDIPKDWFDAVIYAHEFDLENVAPSTRDGLLNYCTFTRMPLVQIALKIIGEEALEDEIRHISTFFGMMECMRSVAYMLAHGRCLLPEDMLLERGLHAKKIIDFNCKKEIVDIVHMLITQTAVPDKTSSAFLNKIRRLSVIYQKQLMKYDCDVFVGHIESPPPLLALRLALNF